MKFTAFITYSLVGCLLFGTFSACSDQQHSPEIATAKTSVRQVMLKVDYASAIGLFDKLSVEEKVAVWQEKLLETVVMDHWNAEQSAFLQDQYEKLSAERYAEPWSEQEDLAQIAEAEELFSQEEVKDVFLTIWPVGKTPPNEPSAKPNTNAKRLIGKSCSCRYSVWCGLDETCDDVPCDSTSSGCGWLWLISCIGECVGGVSMG